MCFFAPRIRQDGQKADMQLRARLKDAVSHMSPGCHFVYGAPLGIGCNEENISLIMHIIGAEAGQLPYYYYPLGGEASEVIGSIDAQENGEISDMISEKEKRFVSIETAERIHTMRVLAKFSSPVLRYRDMQGYKRQHKRRDAVLFPE